MAPRIQQHPVQKHLVKGDAQPPVQKGVLRLYSNRFCPFVQRARLVLDFKQIKYDIVDIHLDSKPEWMFTKSPAGKVPVIETDDGRILDESLIISEYLDEAYPQNQLSSSDPFTKAKDKVLVERFGAAVPKVLFNMLFHQENINEKNVEELRLALDPTEKELEARNTKYFGGSNPGMADLMIFPMLERLVILKVLSPTICTISPERFPKLLQWWKDMKSLEPVLESYLSAETHAKMFESKKTGTTNFDLLMD